jgi:torsin-1
LHHFEKICELGAYNIKGGLQNSGPIEAGVIDHFIPFLPLEKRHVEKCIKSEFAKLYVVPNTEQIE